MRKLMILAVVTVVALALAPAPAVAQSALDEIKQRGELRVAGVLYRPLISPRPSGEYVGLDVEVMKKIAADLKVKLNIINSEWATAVAGIETKKWDLVPALCITDKRKEVVDFVRDRHQHRGDARDPGQQPEESRHPRGVQPAGGGLRRAGGGLE